MISRILSGSDIDDSLLSEEQYSYMDKCENLTSKLFKLIVEMSFQSMLEMASRLMEMLEFELCARAGEKILQSLF